MNIEVRYYSRGGNTKKLAEAVASAVGVKAKDVSEPLSEDADILFLACAPYGFDVDDEVKKFISGINVSVSKAVILTTSAIISSTRKYVEKLFSAKNIPVAKEEFACRGEFMIMHKGRPNESDLTAAADFAKKVIK